MATYSDQAAIMNSSAFVNRITVAVAKYAQFILGNAANQTREQMAWAARAAQSPASIAGQIIGLCIWDAAVTALPNGTISVDAPTLTDTQVQSIVEAAINGYALKWF